MPCHGAILLQHAGLPLLLVNERANDVTGYTYTAQSEMQTNFHVTFHVTFENLPLADFVSRRFEQGRLHVTVNLVNHN